MRLDEPAKALDDLTFLIGANPDDPDALLNRAIAQARLGRKKEALEDLATYQRSYTSNHARLSASAVVAAELGDGTDAAIDALEAALAKDPQDPDLRFDAARAFSLASKAVAETRPGEGRANSRTAPSSS